MRAFSSQLQASFVQCSNTYPWCCSSIVSSLCSVSVRRPELSAVGSRGLLLLPFPVLTPQGPVLLWYDVLLVK